MEMIKNFWDIVSVRYSELIVVGAIIVSAIIVLIGILKPLFSIVFRTNSYERLFWLFPMYFFPLQELLFTLR